MTDSYSFLEFFWTMLIVFIFVVWIFILFRCIMDIFSSRDLSGFAKFAWLLFIFLFIFIGVFAYVIIRGGKMHQHEVARNQERQDEFAAYVREVGGSDGGSADELTRLAALKDSGHLTDAEFAQQKAKILG
ncbi:MAG: SHOCT domain-containing protein [Acidimicrobiia bacterium]|nr:SHOCT domain-containing protein [Acidimicrobiia bacterium]